MTKGGRIFAGIVGLAGAGLFLLSAALAWFILFVGGYNDFAMTLTVIVAIIAFISAILTLTDKTIGCVILLLLGIFMFVQPILINVLGVLTAPYIIQFMWVDQILILFAGILGTAVGSE